jgi:hypothetical protein
MGEAELEVSTIFLDRDNILGYWECLAFDAWQFRESV